MLENMSLLIRLLGVVGFMVIVASCAVATKSTEGTSETFQNTSDASTEMTSSTSPRVEGVQSDAQKAKRFATANLDRLQGDMARGSGEHLTAFAHLLGIRETHQGEFYAFTKQNYPVLFSSEPTTSEEMLARLNTGLDAYPSWRR